MYLLSQNTEHSKRDGEKRRVMEGEPGLLGAVKGPDEVCSGSPVSVYPFPFYPAPGVSNQLGSLNVNNKGEK